MEKVQQIVKTKIEIEELLKRIIVVAKGKDCDDGWYGKES